MQSVACYHLEIMTLIKLIISITSELSLTASDTAVPDQAMFNMTCTTVGLNAVLDTSKIKWMASSG